MYLHAAWQYRYSSKPPDNQGSSLAVRQPVQGRGAVLPALLYCFQVLPRCCRLNPRSRRGWLIAWPCNCCSSRRAAATPISWRGVAMLVSAGVVQAAACKSLNPAMASWPGTAICRWWQRAMAPMARSSLQQKMASHCAWFGGRGRVADRRLAPGGRHALGQRTVSSCRWCELWFSHDDDRNRSRLWFQARRF